MRPLLAALLALVVTANAPAKRLGVTSPAGREIYAHDETFADVSDVRKRRLIVEMVSGLAPEGNLGMLVGVINLPTRGFEYYVGGAYDLAPAFSVPVHARYVFNIDDYRPYIGVGYCYRRLDAVGVDSHNVFFELGYKWVLSQTLHLTAGAGLRRPLVVNVLDGSPVSGPDTDPELLEQQLERSKVWVPTVAVRLSRAF